MISNRYSNRETWRLGVALLGMLLGLASIQVHGSVAIPKAITAINVPALPQSLAERLNRYGHARGALLHGWQGEHILLTTRFGQADQLHRVSQPLGARSQLTFLPEPVSSITTPRRGAKTHAILSWDVGGSEFRQLFLFNLNTGAARMVSDGRSLYDSVIWAPDEQSFVYVTTQRNGRNWDIHAQDLKGNTRVLLETQQGYWYPLDWSADGRHLLVKNRVSINESSVYELDIKSGEMALLLGGPGIAIGDARYDNRGGIYFTSDSGVEFLQLRRLNLRNKAVAVVNNDPWGVEGFVISPDYNKLAYSINIEGYSKLNLLTLGATGQRANPVTLPAIPNSILLSLVFSGDSRRLGVTLISPTSPADVYVLDIDRQTLVRWTRSEVGGLDPDQFVDARLIKYPTFDGRQIPAFVYQPSTPGPHPVVVLIHGGPEAQHRPYFSTTIQSYALEMGAAVVAPNVRGSNGYGKSYLRLDNGKLREDSVKDIGALLDWLATREDLDANRVAVMGGSYGGYMVLASMVHYGPRLSAAVESVGISNFVTFLENTQPYRQDMRRVEYGDERDPDMRRFLQSISPLNHVDKMHTPVLISQGANDPRVPASESEQMRLALTAKGVPVWYILADDEGHGFRKKANRDYDRLAKFAFLEKFLTPVTARQPDIHEQR